VGLLASSALQLLIVVALIFLSLVIVAYAEVVGWVAVGCASTAAVLVIVSMAIQWVSPLRNFEETILSDSSGFLRGSS
jgi:hypothetical protein